MLLLGDDPQKCAAPGADEPSAIEPGEIDGRDCYRVRSRGRTGRVLWIDEETFVLRRLAAAADDLLRRHVETGGPVESLSLVAEFTGATLNGKVDPKLFGFALPKDAEAVKYFMPPPAKSWARRRRS